MSRGTTPIIGVPTRAVKVRVGALLRCRPESAQAGGDPRPSAWDDVVRHAGPSPATASGPENPIVRGVRPSARGAIHPRAINVA
jgi:hypothetical protein